MREFGQHHMPDEQVADSLDEMRGAINAALRKKQRKRVVREIDDVEAKLVERIESLDGLCEKFTKRRGSPDRLAIEGHGLDRAAHLLHDFIKANYPRGPSTLLNSHEGRKTIVRELVAQVIYFVECKVPGEEPNKKQKKDHEKRRKLGLTVRIYDGDWRDE